MPRRKGVFVRRRKSATSAIKKALMNPAGELLMSFAPGLGTYGIVRFLTRIARVTSAKRWPGLQRHAPVVVGLAAFGLAWLLVRKSKRLSKHEVPILVAASIAVVQTIIQNYLPGLAWVFDNAPAGLPAGAAMARPLPQGDDEMGLLEGAGDELDVGSGSLAGTVLN